MNEGKKKEQNRLETEETNKMWKKFSFEFVHDTLYYFIVNTVK